MSQTLILELDDEVYTAIQCQAQEAGTSPSNLVTASLKQLYAKPKSRMTDAEKHAARERFEQHFGAINTDDPTGADNERIDKDLAREYADNHEEG